MKSIYLLRERDTSPVPPSVRNCAEKNSSATVEETLRYAESVGGDEVGTAGQVEREAIRRYTS